MIFNFLGCQEVDVLDKKLKDAKIQNTDFYSLRHDSMFISPPKQFEEEYISLIESISSWPTVSFNKYFCCCCQRCQLQDENEYTLLSLILLFCPDSFHSHLHLTLSSVQLEYFILLQKYLDKKFVTNIIVFIS